MKRNTLIISIILMLIVVFCTGCTSATQSVVFKNTTLYCRVDSVNNGFLNVTLMNGNLFGGLDGNKQFEPNMDMPFEPGNNDNEIPFNQDSDGQIPLNPDENGGDLQKDGFRQDSEIDSFSTTAEIKLPNDVFATDKYGNKTELAEDCFISITFDKNGNITSVKLMETEQTDITGNEPIVPNV